MRTLHVNPVLKAHNVDISMDGKGRWMDKAIAAYYTSLTC